jgi:hypothetical protein
MPRLIRAALGVALVLVATPVLAQDPVPPPLFEEPIGPFVVDARGTLARFKANTSTAAALGVDPAELPARGLGLLVGAHVYPLRRPRFALGIGGELLVRARAAHTIDPVTEDGPDGPTIVTRMTAVSPQVSLNFGKRTGWSYVSGGIGWGSLTTEIDETPFDDAETRPRTINYGGGARWFAQKHLAFSLDLRFYAIAPQAATAARPAFPRTTVMVFSAGVSTR